MPHAPQPTALLQTAAERLRGGDLPGAIAAFEAVLAIDPRQPDAWFNLAWAQRATRQFDAALESYAQGLAQGEPQPEQAHLNRAAILSDHLFRPEAAIVELERALQANPDFLPAWLNLGNLHEDLGDRGAARRAYSAVLARAPDNGRAYARLAAIDVADGAAGAAVARLKTVLPRAASVEDRADLLFALGNALDAAGDAGDAFQAIEAANWITRSIARSVYDPAAHTRLVDALIAAYPAPAPPSPAPPAGAKTPLFICGMFRSGSTLVEKILGQHEAITPGGELEAIPAIVQSLAPYPVALTAGEIATLRARYLAELPGTGIVTDKRCDNFLHIGLIKTLFPEARILHTRRNVLDTLLSTYFLQFGDGVTYGTDLRDAVHFYLLYRRLMAHWERVYGDDIVTVDYDALVTDPQASVSGMLASLGLGWDDACLSAPDSPLAVRTASAWQVRRPIHRESLHRWHRYRVQLGGAIALLEQQGVDVGGG
ncbi:tetratricopeptide repeat-containing sulfotransferase family protein [Sphingomonas sp. PAMC 26621]|uniref:tetratricopeptide repeat-containing sulfotransferase family protein n=1 Tax=Sphingomonas sp. PAMC 26621 TaxID=1112213 RepID=UPI0002880074|nr:sulfotransferase [Sphingomonas sp. PAMC 26621]